MSIDNKLTVSDEGIKFNNKVYEAYIQLPNKRRINVQRDIKDKSQRDKINSIVSAIFNNSLTKIDLSEINKVTYEATILNESNQVTIKDLKIKKTDGKVIDIKNEIFENPLSLEEEEESINSFEKAFIRIFELGNQKLIKILSNNNQKEEQIVIQENQ